MKRLQSEIYEHRLSSAQKAVCEVKNNYRIFIVNVFLFFFQTTLTVRIWGQPSSVAVALNAMEIYIWV